MTSNERAKDFYDKHLVGRMMDEWDGTDTANLLGDLAYAFREASREATREAVDAAFRLLQSGKNRRGDGIGSRSSK